MATKKGPAPAPLDPKVQKKLLDLLSTDNEFRRLFKKDAHAALVKAGWKAPAGCESTAAVSGGACLQMKPGDRIEVEIEGVGILRNPVAAATA